MSKRIRLSIRGQVQGVGFRPNVFRLATECNLSGFVRNDSRGVVVEVQGDDAQLCEFEKRLTKELRFPARIDELVKVEVAETSETNFVILPSDPSGIKQSTVLADIAPCADCLREINDPENRRYRYPFTNCTHCGPRFTIITAVPYDRPNTTMNVFVQCAQCQEEYEDPSNRRFHAQPNACPDCGPTVRLLDPEGIELARGDAAIVAAVTSLRHGKILALEGVGGFQLMVDATSDGAVKELRLRKHRYEKPLAVMVPSLTSAQKIAHFDTTSAALLAAPEAPIVLVKKRGDADISPQIAPGNPRIGLMLPSTPLHHILLSDLGSPVVATSGNLSEEPICISPEQVMVRLRNIADQILVHDRPIARHSDDSVFSFIDDDPFPLRRARGYAPLPILLRTEQPTVLALGGHLKNTIALSVGDRCFVSQHIGDLDTLETRETFERVIADFLKLYDARPVAVAHDFHDDYASTQLAEKLTAPGGILAGVPKIAIQHHYAHFASCLLDADVEEPVLGVVWDGSGLGSDRSIWGGEFFYGNVDGCERIASLLPFRLPGGDAVARHPKRIALSLLLQHFPIERLEALGCRSLEGTSKEEISLLTTQLEKNINAPFSTSMGRLFDAVSSLLGLVQVASYEGQAAMALEFIADQETKDAYPLHIEESTLVSNSVYAPSINTRIRAHTQRPGLPNSNVRFTLNPQEMLEQILMDVAQGVTAPIVAAKFHNGLVDAVLRIAAKLGTTTVALTGGCFQNRLLTERCRAALTKYSCRVLTHRQVSPNDGGLALGQLAVACSLLSRN
jgi:hydrogenase maturation protein HypF